MNITLHRYFEQDKDRTFGILSVDCVFECHTLEDEYRSKKVKSETRIPAGRYQIKFREVETELTKKYRNNHPWFTWHLHLQDVFGFEFIYIHEGNYDTQTAGCILVGEDTNYQNKMITNSRSAYERLYKKIQKRLHTGEEVWITIEDEGEWL